MRHEIQFDPICLATVDETSRISGAAAHSRRSISGIVAGMCLSLLAHAATCIAAIMTELPPDPPPPQPQPMAIMVEFVPDPIIKKEKRQEVQKGDPQSQADHDAAPEPNEQKPIEEARAETLIPPDDTPQLKKIPVPVRKPKPELRKSEKKAPDKTKIAVAKGLADDPLPDVDMGDTLKAPGRMEATIGEEVTRGVVSDLKAQERWQMQLTAHLERRKRYPFSALSRRQEGKVLVRFYVEPDGTVTNAELAQSSNVPALDEEVLDLLHRASPVPKPPPGIVPFVIVPIDFAMKR
ncbi:TonB family protein [Rhizobium sp. A37_96]